MGSGGGDHGPTRRGQFTHQNFLSSWNAVTFHDPPESHISVRVRPTSGWGTKLVCARETAHQKGNRSRVEQLNFLNLDFFPALLEAETSPNYKHLWKFAWDSVTCREASFIITESWYQIKSPRLIWWSRCDKALTNESSYLPLHMHSFLQLSFLLVQQLPTLDLYSMPPSPRSISSFFSH